jgi:hypothetical protein
MWQHQPSVNFCEPYEQEHIRRTPSSLDQQVEITKRVPPNQAFLLGAKYDYVNKHTPAFEAGDRYAN